MCVGKKWKCTFPYITRRSGHRWLQNRHPRHWTLLTPQDFLIDTSRCELNGRLTTLETFDGAEPSQTQKGTSTLRKQHWMTTDCCEIAVLHRQRAFKNQWLQWVTVQTQTPQLVSLLPASQTQTCLQTQSSESGVWAEISIWNSSTPG